MAIRTRINDLYLNRLADTRGVSYLPVKTAYLQDGELDRGIRDFGVPVWEDRVSEDALYRHERGVPRERPSRNREPRRYRAELDRGTGYRSSSNERKGYPGRTEFERGTGYRNSSNERNGRRVRSELDQGRYRSSSTEGGNPRRRPGRYRSSSVDYYRPRYYNELEVDRRHRSSSNERDNPRSRTYIDRDRRYRISSNEREGSRLSREYLRDDQIFRAAAELKGPEVRIVHDTYVDGKQDMDTPIVIQAADILRREPEIRRRNVEILRREPEIELLPRLRDEEFGVRMEREIPVIRVGRESPAIRDSPIFRSERGVILSDRDPEVRAHVPRAVPDGPVFRAPQDRDIPLVRHAHDRDVSPRRPQFERYFPNLQVETDRDGSVHGRSQDFEIPRPLFSPKSSSSYKQRIVSVRVPRTVRPRDRVDSPQSRDRFVQLPDHVHSNTQARDANTQTLPASREIGGQTRSSSHPAQRGVWSEITLQPASKTEFNMRDADIYPPKHEKEGILAKKRRLINEVIAHTDPTFDFFGRNGFGTGKRIRSNPIFLPGMKFARPGTPPVPDNAYFQTIKPSNPELKHITPSPPPLPERHYHDILDLEKTRSAISAFTPFEGQIASRNRNPVLAKWQDTLTKGRRHILLESTQRLYDIEENPDY